MRKKKRTYSGTFSSNTEGIKKKEAFARRLRRHGQGDQMTVKKDDMKEVKNESMQKEGLLSESNTVEGGRVRQRLQSVSWI